MTDQIETPRPGKFYQVKLATGWEKMQCVSNGESVTFQNAKGWAAWTQQEWAGFWTHSAMLAPKQTQANCWK